MAPPPEPRPPPDARHLVVVGGSAGSLEVLLTLVGGLPPGFPAAVAVVVHTSHAGATALPGILSRRAALPVQAVADREAIRPGRIYVAPGGVHMSVRDGRFRLEAGPRENGHRPAIDRLFRSAADAFRSRAIGVLLSGNLHDGAAGSVAITAGGGTVLVQDPEEARYPEMPSTAIALDDPDEVLPGGKMAHRLGQLVEEVPSER